MSGDVDAAREALWHWIDPGDVHQLRPDIRHALGAFEAAIRAECDEFEEYANTAIADRDRMDAESAGTLDVERLADWLLMLPQFQDRNPTPPMSADEARDRNVARSSEAFVAARFIVAQAAERARLAEADR